MVRRPKEIKSPKRIWLQNPLPEAAQKKPFLVITAMLYLCKAIDSGDSYRKKIIALIKENPQIPIYKLGFLNNWDKEPIWGDE